MSIRVEKITADSYLVVTDTILTDGNYLQSECVIDGDCLVACDRSYYHSVKKFASSILNISLGDYYRIVTNMKVGDKIVF